jgi:uncharacterized repeat protein (TIGR03803 family)
MPESKSLVANPEWRFRMRTFNRLIAALLLVFAAAGAVGAQTYTVLYNLGSKTGDPLNPTRQGSFAQARDGNLYSTSQTGGTNGQGTVFRLTPSGAMTVVYSFDDTHGAQPNGGLTLGTDGYLYGTTYYGGSTGFGTIFKITTGGALTSLHTFNGTTEGNGPLAAPIEGLDGNFYGTTSDGGGEVFGTVYKMTPAGAVSVLYTFGGSDRYPYALALGTDGDFYGTFTGGGTDGYGGIFKITPNGAFTMLNPFDGSNGQFPESRIIQASDGSFYGTTNDGGSGSAGVVYEMTRAGVLTDLISFANNGLGYGPYAGLLQATDGNFYGAAESNPGVSLGVIYQLTPSGTHSMLFNLTNTGGAYPGAYPQVPLFQHTTGTIYGDTEGGGTAGMGVLYSLDMGLGPFVSLLPTSAKVGKTVEFLGQGFTGTTAVSFNRTPAAFHVVSDTYLTATVPSGAKTGPVTVATSGGTLTSKTAFQVAPQLTSFNPPSGPVGAQVIIMGVSLTQTTSVVFGGVKAATFKVNSDTQVTATVPASALTGKIVITTPGGTAASATSFTVTP